MPSENLRPPRDIPAPIKREVRKRSGFGCVICRLAPCEYHHFDPPYHELKGAHRAEGIALLCPNHHAKVRENNPEITNARVKDRYEHQPKARAKYENDLDPTRPLLLIIGNEEHQGELAIRRNSRELLTYKYDPEHGWLLNFEVTNEASETIFQVEDNAMLTPGGAEIDFDWSGGQLIWRDRNTRHMYIHIRLDGDRNAFVVEHIDAYLGGVNFTKSSSGLLAPRLPGEQGLPSGLIGVAPGASVTVVDCIEIYQQPDGSEVTRHIGHMKVDRTGKLLTGLPIVNPTALSQLLPLEENGLPRVNIRPKATDAPRASGHLSPNNPCPCGSGKKFKKCHGRQA